MTTWIDLTPRDRSQELPAAMEREVSPGQYRYVFEHEGEQVNDPSHDVTGQLFVSPRKYGFSIRGFQGGKTAWARDFANGTMLLSSPDGQSHVLSPRFPARIVFLGADGAILQDSGGERRVARESSEFVTVRLTVSATVDLNGESQELARVQIMRMLDVALAQRMLPAGSDIRLVDHTIEQATVQPDRRTPSSDTDFSQLLDL